jgi:hypothetical protein
MFLSSFLQDLQNAPYFLTRFFPQAKQKNFFLFFLVIMPAVYMRNPGP